MIRQIIHRSLLAGMLVMSLTPLAYADRSGHPPVSRGIVLSIMAINPQTDTATLRADDGGQEFQTTAYASWKVGEKVECDLVDISPGPQLQNCQPWQ